jgi:hypothetical protein
VQPILGGVAGEQISLLGSFALSGSKTPTLYVGTYKCTITGYGVTSISATVDASVPTGSYKITVTDKSGSQCSSSSYKITGKTNPSGSCAVSMVQPVMGACAGTKISMLGVFALNGSNTPEVYVGSYKCTVTNYSISSIEATVNPSVPEGYHKVKVIDKGGAVCTYPADINIKVKAKPPISMAANPPYAYCGDTVQITIFGGLLGGCKNYEGSCGGKLIGTSFVAMYVNPTKTTTYYASNTNECGESECVSFTLEVKKPAAPTKLTAYPSTIKCGQSSRLTIVGGRENACYNYEDSCGGKVIGNSSVNFYVKPIKTTTYYVRNGVKGAPECGFSDCAFVKVNVTCNQGIDSPDSDNTFSIYTSQKTLYVNYNRPSNEKALLSIYNITGQKLIEFNIKHSTFNIPLDFSPGIYFVKAETSDKIYVRKVYIE